MNTPTQLEKLFFEVRNRPPFVSLDDRPREVKSYQVITCTDGILGVKPVWLADAKPPLPSALGRHLVFDHRQADALSQELYELTFGVSPTPLHWVGAPPLGEDLPLGAWAAVVYGHTGYTVADVLKNPELRPGRYSDKPVAAWERALWDGDESFAQELALFKPALAFTNGFDYDDELTFHVLVTLPTTEAPAPEWELQDDQLMRRQRRPVLVLETGKFKVEYVRQLYKLTGADLLAGARKALPDLAKSFQEELVSFANLYYHLRQIPAKAEELVPVVLDLYDNNRNVNTIRRDGDLRRRTKRRMDVAWQFFGHGDDNLAGLMRFFMFTNAFDPSAFDQRAAEQVLIQRDAYRNLAKRLSSDNSKQDLTGYLASQLRDYEAVAQEIGYKRP